MIKSFFGKKTTVSNGTGEEIQLSSGCDDLENPAWLLDTYRLARSLSQGDKSVPLAAFQEIKKGGDDDVKFLTAAGSMTQELWSRMVWFGYGTSTNDSTLPNSKLFSPNPKRLHIVLQFLLAAMVDEINDADIKPISHALAKERFKWVGIKEDTLVQLRLAFNQTKKPLLAPPLKENPLFRDFLKLGVVKKPTGQEWPVSVLGQVTMPFVFDFILEQKGFDWEDLNER